VADAEGLGGWRDVSLDDVIHGEHTGDGLDEAIVLPGTAAQVSRRRVTMFGTSIDAIRVRKRNSELTRC